MEPPRNGVRKKSAKGEKRRGGARHKTSKTSVREETIKKDYWGSGVL